MKVFIRTQDRTKILEIDCVYYEEKKTTRKTVQSDNVTSETVETRHRLICCNRTLGEYGNKARCLEIMDDIQRTIDSRSSYSSIVYNMPEA
jgi:hypothetical protein